MYVASALLPLCLLLVTSAPAQAEDGYLTTSRALCHGSGGLLDCGKYQLARLLHRLAATPRSFDMGPLRLVSMPQGNSSDTSSNLLPREAAPQAQLPEYMRMLQFGVRQAELFLNSHGLSLPLSSTSGAKLMYDDGTGPTTFTDAAETQARSRNLHIVVPLMIMVKLMAIKGLLIPTLIGVAAIKKFIIFTVMILPSVIHKLKVCKIVPHFVHYSPQHTHSHEFHDDYVPHHDYNHHHQDIHRRIGAGGRSWL